MSELDDALTDDELLLWMAKYELEPWGITVQWRQFGEIMALLHNIFRGENDDPRKASDYIPT